MKILKTIMVALIVTSFVGCKDSKQAQWNALGKPHIVRLYGCDGKLIQQWESTGSISNSEHSDGWYFEDVATGKLVEVTGTLVIDVK